MSAEDHLEVCRMVARYVAEDMDTPDEAPGPADKGIRAETSSEIQQPAYTRQQVAAFKAHATMVRKSLAVLTGDAQRAAIQKLSRYEARLAAALAPRHA